MREKVTGMACTSETKSLRFPPQHLLARFLVPRPRLAFPSIFLHAHKHGMLGQFS